jgi:putative Mn2+ efflux pump MntP
MIIAGLGMSGFGTMQSILVISKASQKIRGRVLGVLAITIGTQPIGAFVLGYFSREYGSSYAVAISIILAIAILLFIGAWYKLSELSN